MPRKGTKCPLAWTLLDENIENVEHLKFDADEQRELGCVVGEHVFLEYPWAFVPRDTVIALSKKSGSALEQFRQRIELYESCAFLIGYSSNTIFANDFVICLSEEAKLAVIKRNKRITKAILDKVSRKMTRKSMEPWKSLGSQLEITDCFVENTRGYFEVDVLLTPDCVGSYRQLSDQSANVDERNSVELVAKEEESYENIERKCISREVQTHFGPRSIEIQTYSDYERNAWTQYEHDDTFDESNIDSTEESSISKNNDGDTPKSEAKDAILKSEVSNEEKLDEKTPLELFLENSSIEMIDIIKYNAVVNLHVDDIRSLSGTEYENKVTVHPTYEHLLSLIAFSVAGKAISSVCCYPELKNHVAISYKTTPFPKNDRTTIIEGVDKFKFDTGVLIWSLNDPLHPKLELQDYRDIYSVSCCPVKNDIIIGGCCTGQLVIWNIKDRLSHHESQGRVKNTQKPICLEQRNGGVPVARPIFVSDKCHSHRLPVRKIQWMPANYKIEPTGKLTKLVNCLSSQFLTASEDGTIAVWDLPVYLNSLKVIGNSSEALRPIFKITIRLPDESFNFCLLTLCLPSLDVFQERNPSEQRRSVLNPEEEDYLKSLWIGTTRGLVRCIWEDQVFDVVNTGVGECKFLNHSYVHDGPVREILRSPHLRDVLLTIGGHVFALWKDDYLDTPLFWRRSCAFYTACSWANRPGVVLIGRDDGQIEIWDLKENSNEPVGVQTLSEKAITCMILLESSGSQCVIGAGDAVGIFRVLKDPVEYSFESVLGKLDWFEEYIWKEVRRKRVFRNWQEDYLSNDPGVLAKKAAQHAEGIRQKQEEARAKLQREHEERVRAEEKRRELLVPKSKDVLWKLSNIERMEKILLRKKGLARAELEEKRQPLLDIERNRDAKLSKARDKVALRGEYFKQAVATEFPEIFNELDQIKQDEEKIDIPDNVADFVRQYMEIRDRARDMLKEYSKK